MCIVDVKEIYERERELLKESVPTAKIQLRYERYIFAQSCMEGSWNDVSTDKYIIPAC